MTLRQEKLQEQIKNFAALFLQSESNYTSLITVTRANISSDLKNSTIYFTVLPIEGEVSALNFAKRQRSNFRDFVKKRTKMKSIPFFDFEIDKGEKNRQKIDELAKNA